ncbi:hypothetical protein FSP39_017228 [Pinctada imbricata]|uniref:Uncharacterized protein n=1 Tax=Pinctada imbricata TaxID=66713 RepID=A0AA89BUX0_PINIB|nr:hypothetical protein FSP39_017228 [Pinctada imbricata]
MASTNKGNKGKSKAKQTIVKETEKVKENESSFNTSDLLADCRSILYGADAGGATGHDSTADSTADNQTVNVCQSQCENASTVKLATLVDSVLVLLQKMDTRLSVIEKRTETLEVINSKITKLDARVGVAENEIKTTKTKISEIEADLQGNSNLYDDVKGKTDELDNDLLRLKKRIGKVEKMTDEISRLQEENGELHESLLEMKCRSMKYNLLFSGIAEADGENCENVLKKFIQDELQIEKEIPFANVHRVGKKCPENVERLWLNLYRTRILCL